MAKGKPLLAIYADAISAVNVAIDHDTLPKRIRYLLLRKKIKHAVKGVKDYLGKDQFRPTGPNGVYIPPTGSVK